MIHWLVEPPLAAKQTNIKKLEVIYFVYDIISLTSSWRNFGPLFLQSRWDLNTGPQQHLHYFLFQPFCNRIAGRYVWKRFPLADFNYETDIPTFKSRILLFTQDYSIWLTITASSLWFIRKKAFDPGIFWLFRMQTLAKLLFFLKMIGFLLQTAANKSFLCNLFLFVPSWILTFEAGGV